MKTWDKPMLIVLVRGKPEEAILTACKAPEYMQSQGPGYIFYTCFRLPDDGVGCASCSQTPDS